MASGDQLEYKVGGNLREWVFVCKNLREQSIRTDSPENATKPNLINNHPERIDV